LQPATNTDRAAGNNLSQGNTISRAVTLVEQLGEHCYLHLETADSETLIAKAPGDWDSSRAVRCTFSVPPDACHLFTDNGLAVVLTPTLQFA